MPILELFITTSTEPLKMKKIHPIKQRFITSEIHGQDQVKYTRVTDCAESTDSQLWEIMKLANRCYAIDNFYFGTRTQLR